MIIFPADVPGWLTEAEGRRLADLAAGKNVLEIGSYYGRSTVCLAQTARRVLCVDTFGVSKHPGVSDAAAEFLRTIERFGIAEKVTAIRGRVEDVLPTLIWPQVNLVWIDDGHGESETAAQITLCDRLPGAAKVWALHDWANPQYPGVKAAASRLLGAPQEVVDSLGIFDAAAAKEIDGKRG